MYQADAEGREKSRAEMQRFIVQGRLRACSRLGYFAATKGNWAQGDPTSDYWLAPRVGSGCACAGAMALIRVPRPNVWTMLVGTYGWWESHPLLQPRWGRVGCRGVAPGLSIG